MHQDHNPCGTLTVIMSTQDAGKWAIKTAKLNPKGHQKRFNDTTTITNTFDEVAIFVVGVGGFNVENGHEIVASSPNCGSRYSVQIIVNLEESVKNLHKIDEVAYLKDEYYSKRLSLENQAIDILRQHHSSVATANTLYCCHSSVVNISVNRV